jgi:hypothetical protein
MKWKTILPFSEGFFAMILIGSKLDFNNDIYIVERNKPRRCGRFHKSKLEVICEELRFFL